MAAAAEGAPGSTVDARQAEGAPMEGERQRRRRRGRGGRDRDENRREADGVSSGVEPPVETLAIGEGPAGAEAEPRADFGDEGGRRRGRGRQRREEREAPGVELEAAAESVEFGAHGAMASAAPEHSAALMAVVEPAAAEVGIGATQVTEAPPPTAMPMAGAVTSPVTQAAPVAEAFELPIDELREIARSAGLEWINSDAERIQIAQQAIADEPKPARVPRQPRPPVVVDEGPLILVETRKDLAQLKLPFDQGGAGAVH